MKQVRDTSIESHLQARATADNRHREILRVLLASRDGLTDFEIAKQLGKDDPNYVRPRRFELTYEFSPALVVDAGKRQCNITGKTCHIWKIAQVPSEQIVRVRQALASDAPLADIWVMQQRMDAMVSQLGLGI